MTISKKFKVASAGATTDGRQITEKQIQQMATNYDPKVYGARLWLEHQRGFYPDSIFGAYGDVLSLEAMEENGVLGLYATISPNANLLEINQRKQKIYTSIEMDTSFADTNEAYLKGLGITDSPASLGTEAMQFSQKTNYFSNRKQKPENLLSEAIEVNLEFSEEKPKEDTTKFMDKIKSIFNKQQETNNGILEQSEKNILQYAELQNKVNEDFSAKQSDIQKELNGLKENFNKLKQQLEKEPEQRYHQRNPSTGNTDEFQAEC